MPIAYPKFIKTADDAIKYLEANEKFRVIRNPRMGRYYIREENDNWSKQSLSAVNFLYDQHGYSMYGETWESYQRVLKEYPTEEAVLKSMESALFSMVKIERRDAPVFKAPCSRYEIPLSDRSKYMAGRVLYGWSNRISPTTFNKLLSAHEFFPDVQSAIGTLIPFGYKFSALNALDGCWEDKVVHYSNVSTMDMDRVETTDGQVNLAYMLLKHIYGYRF